MCIYLWFHDIFPHSRTLKVFDDLPEECGCFQTNVLCSDDNLTTIPILPDGVSTNTTGEKCHINWFTIDSMENLLFFAQLQVTLLYLKGNQLELTDNSLDTFNLTHKL